MTGRRSPGPAPKLTGPPKEEEFYALNRFLKRIAETHYGIPAPHATTHMQPSGTEGADSIASGQLPSTITLGSEGDIGDATLGFATADHDHPNDLGGFADLAEIEVDEIDGVPIEDVNVRRLLEEILVVTGEIAERVEGLK